MRNASRLCVEHWKALTAAVFLFRQDVYDKLDYLSSLGKTQTAAVQRDADIGVAEAERDAGIKVRLLRRPLSAPLNHSST